MDELDEKKVLWHSRRGMLELDLLLIPFASGRFASLSAERKQLYMELLRCEDQDIFAWLLQREKPVDARLEEIIGLILETSASSN
ncbi:MAG: succinate dehydrogenase assembly factor 2 [Pseudohongiellaceae bacterium]